MSLVSWTIFNYLSDHAATHILLFTRLTILGGVAAIYSVLYFIANFPARVQFKRNISLLIHASLTVVLVPIVFLPEFISSVTIKQFSGSVNTSYLYWIFIVYVFYSLLLLFAIIRSQYRNSKSSAEKQQVSIISWGIILYAVLAILSNVLLPLLIDNWSSSRFGPAFTLIFVSLVGYTIVKHRLFDIRLIVARSAAYILSLGFITLVFSLVIFGISNITLTSNFSKKAQQFIYVIVTLTLVITYPTLKKFFNRLTNKLFYRDAYEPQLFFNDLSRVLVSGIDLKKILQNSAEVIEQNIKPVSVNFEIYSNGAVKNDYVTPINGRHNTNLFSAWETESLRTSKQKLIVTDELKDKEQTLKRVLSENNISIVSHLLGSGQKDEVTAYLLLGPKKSGNIYNKQDKGVIATISDEFAIAIQNALHFEEIQNFNITLQEKIENATRQLRKANQRLKTLDETKDDFISMASHQLRTPLTSVKGYLSMVLEGDTGKITNNQRKFLGQAFFSSQRMVYLIADLLNVSRLKTGKFVIERAKTNLADVVKDEVEQLKETAENKHLELTYHRPDHFPVVNIDETKTRQVIMNFMDNAIYYTPSGGKIDIKLTDNPKTIDFTVTDNGIGVPKSEQHHLFSKFYRAGNARKARPDGTGLGLFMAKKVVIAQGGSIIFQTQEGKGSTFGFSFRKDHMLADNTNK